MAHTPSNSQEIINEAYEFVGKHREGTVEFTFDKNVDGSYVIFVVRTDGPLESTIIGSVRRDATGEAWIVQYPYTMDDLSDSRPGPAFPFDTRRDAASRLWSQIVSDWCEAARAGELDSPEAQQYNDEWEAQRLNYFVDTLEGEIERAQKTITKFAEELLRDPVHAFEWASNEFGAAATIQVNTEALGWLKAQTDAEGNSVGPVERLTALHELATRKVISGARSPSRSSNDTRNLIAQAVVAAWAEIAESMGMRM